MSDKGKRPERVPQSQAQTDMGIPRSLLLVTVDCLRADHAGFLGYRRPTTPFLDSLVTESLVFLNAIVAGSPTYYSFPAIMASRYPLSLGRDVVGLAPGESTLATVLDRRGYATGAFLAGNPYLSPRFGYDAGFDVFNDFLNPDENARETRPETTTLPSRTCLNLLLGDACHRLKPVGALYDELYFQYCMRSASAPPPSMDALRRFPSADVIVDHAAEWLANCGKQPFFLWLHFMDPHAPYYPPQQALEEMGDAGIDAREARYLNSYWNRSDLGLQRLVPRREKVIALYDAGIRWVDIQMERLVGKLRALGLWDDCVVALTADHGEEFLDHSDRYHAPTKLPEEIVNAPLLLRVPGAAKGSPQQPFSLLHLSPTLLNALDVAIPETFLGRSYWPELQRGESWQGEALVECIKGCTNPFVTEKRLGPRLVALRESRFKLVFDFATASDSLFDLQADPGELSPLPTDAEKQTRRRLLEKLRQHISGSLNLRDAASVLAVRLRDLQLELAQPAVEMCA